MWPVNVALHLNTKTFKIYMKDIETKVLEVLGFPCNQFGAQEAGTNEEIQSFCDLTFNVSFKMFDKIEVNGSNASPLFKYLKHESPGILGTEAVKWNFTKFLVNKDGQVVKRFAPKDGESAIESELQKIL